MNKKLILVLTIVFLTGCSGCKTNENGSGFANYIPWWANNTNIVSTNSVSINLDQ